MPQSSDSPIRRTLHIHFGIAKTGSTSIQRSLSKFDGQRDFGYLKGHALAACRDLATAFMAKPWQFRPLKRRGLTPEALATRRVEILKAYEQQLQAGPHRFLLSSETLSEFDEPSLQALAEWFTPRVDEIRLVGYVRPITGYLESMFQQGIKNGNGQFLLERKYPDFQERFERLERVFGAERIAYRRFAPADFRHQCVVTDLADHIGLGDVTGLVERVNDGLSLDAVKLLYLYRQKGPEFGEGPHAVRDNNRLIRHLAGLSGPKLRLSQQLVAPILQAHEADLAWMEQRLGASLREALRPDDALSITGEADMLSPSAQALDWLAALARPARAAAVRQGKPEAIVRTLNDLKLRPDDADDTPTRPGATRPRRAARADTP